MRKKLMGILGIAACTLMFRAPLAQAQSDVPRFEIGAQYSLLNFNTFACCTKAHRKESGGGGRFTLNFNKYIAAEAQLDYFPNSDVERIGTIDVPLWGSKTLIVAGVKAGSRNDRWGGFAKARPGFVHFSSVPGFYALLLLVPVRSRLKRTLRSMLAASLNITHRARWSCDSTPATRSFITRESSEPRISFKGASVSGYAFS